MRNVLDTLHEEIKYPVRFSFIRVYLIINDMDSLHERIAS